MNGIESLEELRKRVADQVSKQEEHNKKIGERASASLLFMLLVVFISVCQSCSLLAMAIAVFNEWLR